METIETFEVLDPGILTTIQDLGRHGLARFGVPPSGASDSFSFRAANLLAGNREAEACLEITIMGLRMRALREIVVSITGGDLTPLLNGDPLAMWKTHLLVEGDIVAFKKVRTGCRAYLAAGGGISVSPVMGSRATCLSGKFGGLEGRALKRGDLLSVPDVPPLLKNVGTQFPGVWVPDLKKEASFKVIFGPQDDHFTQEGIGTFRSSVYEVSRQCDRTGIRLQGPIIRRRPDVEESIISEGLVPGVIQVPGDGQPMMILTETVTGGYAKIATVISAELSRIAQLKPGDRVRFESIGIEEAHRLLREQEERLSAFAASLQRG